MTQSLQKLRKRKEERLLTLEQSNEHAREIPVPQDDLNGALKKVNLSAANLAELAYTEVDGEVRPERENILMNLGSFVVSDGSIESRLRVHNTTSTPLMFKIERVRHSNSSEDGLESSRFSMLPEKQLTVGSNEVAHVVFQLSKRVQLKKATEFTCVCEMVASRVNKAVRVTVRAVLQPLVLQFSHTTIDFGNVLGHPSAEETRRLDIYNPTGSAVKLKAVLWRSKKTDAQIELNPENRLIRANAKGHASFDLTLRPSWKQEAVAADLYVGIEGPESQFKVHVKANVCKPQLEYEISDRQFGSEEVLQLPPSFPSQQRARWLLVRNKGNVTVPLSFRCDNVAVFSCVPARVSLSPGAEVKLNITGESSTCQIHRTTVHLDMVGQLLLRFEVALCVDKPKISTKAQVLTAQISTEDPSIEEGGFLKNALFKWYPDKSTQVIRLTASIHFKSCTYSLFIPQAPAAKPLTLKNESNVPLQATLALHSFVSCDPDVIDLPPGQEVSVQLKVRLLNFQSRKDEVQFRVCGVPHYCGPKLTCETIVRTTTAVVGPTIVKGTTRSGTRKEKVEPNGHFILADGSHTCKVYVQNVGVLNLKYSIEKMKTRGDECGFKIVRDAGAFEVGGKAQPSVLMRNEIHEYTITLHEDCTMAQLQFESNEVWLSDNSKMQKKKVHHFCVTRGKPSDGIDIDKLGRYPADAVGLVLSLSPDVLNSAPAIVASFFASEINHSRFPLMAKLCAVDDKESALEIAALFASLLSSNVADPKQVLEQAQAFNTDHCVFGQQPSSKAAKTVFQAVQAFAATNASHKIHLLHLFSHWSEDPGNALPLMMTSLSAAKQSQLLHRATKTLQRTLRDEGSLIVNERQTLRKNSTTAQDLLDFVVTHANGIVNESSAAATAISRMHDLVTIILGNQDDRAALAALLCKLPLNEEATILAGRLSKAIGRQVGDGSWSHFFYSLLDKNIQSKFNTLLSITDPKAFLLGNLNALIRLGERDPCLVRLCQALILSIQNQNLELMVGSMLSAIGHRELADAVAIITRLQTQSTSQSERMKAFCSCLRFVNPREAHFYQQHAVKAENALRVLLCDDQRRQEFCSTNEEVKLKFCGEQLALTTPQKKAEAIKDITSVIFLIKSGKNVDRWFASASTLLRSCCPVCPASFWSESHRRGDCLKHVFSAMLSPTTQVEQLLEQVCDLAFCAGRDQISEITRQVPDYARGRTEAILKKIMAVVQEKNPAQVEKFTDEFHGYGKSTSETILLRAKVYYDFLVAEFSLEITNQLIPDLVKLIDDCEKRRALMAAAKLLAAVPAQSHLRTLQQLHVLRKIGHTTAELLSQERQGGIVSVQALLLLKEISQFASPAVAERVTLFIKCIRQVHHTEALLSSCETGLRVDPRWKKGKQVTYKSESGKLEKVTIVKVHCENVELYYTIHMPSINRERQSTLVKLSEEDCTNNYPVVLSSQRIQNVSAHALTEQQLKELLRHKGLSTLAGLEKQQLQQLAATHAHSDEIQAVAAGALGRLPPVSNFVCLLAAMPLDDSGKIVLSIAKQCSRIGEGNPDRSSTVSKANLHRHRFKKIIQCLVNVKAERALPTWLTRVLRASFGESAPAKQGTSETGRSQPGEKALTLVLAPLAPSFFVLRKFLNPGSALHSLHEQRKMPSDGARAIAPVNPVASLSGIISAVGSLLLSCEAMETSTQSCQSQGLWSIGCEDLLNALLVLLTGEHPELSKRLAVMFAIVGLVRIDRHQLLEYDPASARTTPTAVSPIRQKKAPEPMSSKKTVSPKMRAMQKMFAPSSEQPPIRDNCTPTIPPKALLSPAAAAVEAASAAIGAQTAAAVAVGRAVYWNSIVAAMAKVETEGHHDREEWMYHMTDDKSGQLIADSCMMKPGSKGMFGAGIYFCLKPADCQHKALRKGVLIKAKVRLGRSLICRSKNPTLNKVKVQQVGCLSVKAPGGFAVSIDE
jgi:hypothetical protein